MYWKDIRTAFEHAKGVLKSAQERDVKPTISWALYKEPKPTEDLPEGAESGPQQGGELARSSERRLRPAQITLNPSLIWGFPPFMFPVTLDITIAPC